MMNGGIYIGTGERNVPKYIENICVCLGELLGKSNLVLRSGGDIGCESKFENGCNNVFGKSEIYLPWDGFNHHSTSMCSISYDAFDLLNKYYKSLFITDGDIDFRTGRVKIFARCFHMLLGKTLDHPAQCLLTYSTSNYGVSAFVVKMANMFEIPVVNMFHLRNAIQQCDDSKYSILTASRIVLEHLDRVL